MFSLMRRDSRPGFALYEVLLGVAIFAIGVIALGRAVGHCVTASSLSAEDARARQILANRMAEIEATPGTPDKVKLTKIDTGYGTLELVQNVAPVEMQEENVIPASGQIARQALTGLWRVSLTAKWQRGSADQSKQIAFYIYRAR